jgi:hypothetical protein
LVTAWGLDRRDRLRDAKQAELVACRALRARAPLHLKLSAADGLPMRLVHLHRPSMCLRCASA